MADPLVGLVHSLSTAVLLLAAFTGVGLAARIALTRWFALPGSLGLTAGLGAVAASTAVSLGYRLTGSVLPGIAVTGAGCVLALGTGIMRAARRRVGPWAAISNVARAAASKADGLIAVVVVVVTLPVLVLGPAPFSVAGWDFHRYVGSALAWLSRSGIGPVFAVVHPDNYGLDQVDRAHFEKPYSTGFMVVSTLVSGSAPFRLQAALTAVLLLITVSCLYLVVTRVFRVSGLVAVACAAIPPLSLGPVARAYDAQVGHLVAVAFTAVLLAAAATVIPGGGRGQRAVVGLVLGVVLAACIGSNFTLVAAAVPVFLAALVWIWERAGVQRSSLLILLGSAVLTTLVTSAPFLDWFAHSFRLQSTGHAFSQIALPPPTALLGLPFQVATTGVDPRPWTATAVIGWALILAAVIVVGLARWRRGASLGGWLPFAVLALGSLLLLAARLGPSTYGTHKWAVYVIAVTGPLVLAALAAQVPRSAARALRLGAAAALAVTAGSVLVYGAALPQAGNVVPDDLLVLEHDPTLISLAHVNVDFGRARLTENVIGPVIIPTRAITVLPGTDDYFQPSAPVGDLVLTRRDTAEECGWPVQTPLNATYVLAHGITCPADTPAVPSDAPTPS